jgi:hypothetical protein
MHPHPLIWIAVAVLVGYAIWGYAIWGRKRNGAIAREIRMMRAIKGVAAAYRAGDYALALQKTERLALKILEKNQDHFRQASEIDPQGIFGRLARAMFC